MQFIYLCQKAMVTFFDPGNRSFAICWKLIPYDYVDGWLVGWLLVWHDENDLVVYSANHLSSRPSVHPFIHLFIYAFHSFILYLSFVHYENNDISLYLCHLHHCQNHRHHSCWLTDWLPFRIVWRCPWLKRAFSENFLLNVSSVIMLAMDRQYL